MPIQHAFGHAARHGCAPRHRRMLTSWVLSLLLAFLLCALPPRFFLDLAPRAMLRKIGGGLACISAALRGARGFFGPEGTICCACFGVAAPKAGIALTKGIVHGIHSPPQPRNGSGQAGPATAPGVQR